MRLEGVSARLVAGRGLRGFADGLVSVLLAAHLSALGFSSFQVGALVTATLLGSALLTLGVGLVADRLDARRVLLAGCALMFATGLGFAASTDVALLFALAFVGTLNPSGGDVSLFLPTEQALLAAVAPEEARPTLYARYNVAGALLGAFGALAAGLPDLAVRAFGVERGAALRASFLVYAGMAVALATLYRRLPPRPAAAPAARRLPLARSRRQVLELTALFSLDSFGGGFVVQSILALWLFERFGLSLAAAAAFFFAANLAAALSQLLAAPLARRIGLVRTMVFTHLPANLFLLAAGLVEGLAAALALLLLRAALSQMDVPARQALVMGLVPPEERAAAAGVTNVPRSLASALPPLLAGGLLGGGAFAWPLLLGGGLKAVYDLLLLARYGRTGR